MKLETAMLSFHLKESKEVSNDGTNLGIFSGHLAAFEKDRGGDIFVPGAFQASIDRHKQNDRPIRMLRQHNSSELIGGFPIGFVREDREGLFVEGHINLDVQAGREAYALMKQDVLTDMSIGFSVVGDHGSEITDGVRYLKEVDVWEGSLVTEPMNVRATVTDVKSIMPFQDLPLAPRDRAWDSVSAARNIKGFAEYKNAFLYLDGEDSDGADSYRLPIADVINGKLTAIPKAIFAAAEEIKAAQGDLPEADKRRVINHLERYYAKMDIDSPFEEKSFLTIEAIKDMSVRDIEKSLRESGAFSKSAASYLASRVNIGEEKKYSIDEASLLIAIRETTKALSS